MAAPNSDAGEVCRSDFPAGFVFGVATSAYQVEGATNEDGKGDNIWDVFTKINGYIKDGSNADISVDQYHRYKEDVELIAKLGFEAYRFSISWSRIFPDGLGNKVNEKGIAYYNHLIDYLLKNGIQPYVTLYHWDLPYNLHVSEGGWLSEKVVEYFALYAEVCFARFGDRVKHWMTINEPLQTAVNGYSIGIFAPGRRDSPYKEPYLAAHYQILAHAAAVDVYRKKFKATQGGEIGLVVDCEWAEAFSDKEQDKVSVERRLDFQLGWFLDPIFYGDYPAVMRERLGDHLPQFTQKDKELLQNAIDFIGLNHYTTKLIAHSSDNSESPFYEAQEMERIVKWQGGELIGERAASEWLYIVPWGLRKVLNYIARKYKNFPIYVTENGMDDEENESATLNDFLNDEKRVRYFKGYLGAVAQAIRDGVDVRGYFAWSLLDNFEWAQGYTKRFGLVYVDYKNGLKRYPKSSAFWFSHFLKDKSDNGVGQS
ncbi:beta-glucosidase 4 isoform X1 [Phalaenopsis equestris]|uniref:beta-glucosidase 4 isoform X1 n=1 Tax=Phalaenopsis equestris TaxID=78828 RepID=UPI0009E48109|nr:beta-glucosidase 4 isoform X1 [Phalaenopsis equestris]